MPTAAISRPNLMNVSSTSGWSGRKYVWPVVIILLVALLQMVYFTGLIASDDIAYLRMARMAQSGDLHFGAMPHAYRLVHWTLLSWFLTLFPRVPWTAVLPCLLASWITLWMVWRFADCHLNSRSGLLSMVILGLVPLVIVESSMPLPWPVATALSWGGVYLVAAPLMEHGVRRAAARCLVGGFLMGLAYSTAEPMAILVPSLFLFVLLFRRRHSWAWARFGLISLGTALWVGLEMLLFWRYTGDPLYHAHMTSHVASRMSGPVSDMTPVALFAHWTGYVRMMANRYSEFGLTGMVLLAGLVHALVKRTGATSLLLCLILPMFIYLSMGSEQLSHYRPIYQYPRYLMPLLPGMAILAGWMVERFWRLHAWTRPVVALATGAVIAFSLTAPNQFAGKGFRARTFRAGYELLTKDVPQIDQPIRVYASNLTRARFDVFADWLQYPCIDEISQAPTSVHDWVRRFGGAYVLVSRLDRAGSYDSVDDTRAFCSDAVQSLSWFECVARREPPRDRLGWLKARLLGRTAPTDSAYAVELWRVATSEEWGASQASRTQRLKPSGDTRTEDGGPEAETRISNAL